VAVCPRSILVVGKNAIRHSEGSERLVEKSGQMDKPSTIGSVRRCHQVGKPGLIMPRRKRPFRWKSPALLGEDLSNACRQPRDFQAARRS
jgi:hypothetical protein